MDLNSGTKGITLSKVDAKGGLRTLEIVREKATLVTRASVGGKAPKETRKKLKDEQEATREYNKAVRGKIRDGYAFLADPDKAKHGAVVFAGFASGGGGGPVLDFSLDGRFLLTAGCNGAPKSVWVERIDTRTGERTRVFERNHPRQIFLHDARFLGDGGEMVVAVEEETLRVDLTTGKAKRLASYQEGSTATFNPHVLRPQLSGDRSRVVLFDAGSVIRVVHLDGQTLLEVSTKHPTTECRAAAISPSGRLLAVYRVSRGLVYNHEDARKDTTNAVDIWSVETGKQVASLALKEKLHRVEIDPTDRVLLVSWDYAQGPVAHDIATGKELFRFDSKDRDDRLSTAYQWAYSPDGAWLAIGSDRLQLLRADTRKPEKIEEGGYRAHRVIFSGDGALLASCEDGLAIVRKVVRA